MILYGHDAKQRKFKRRYVDGATYSDTRAAVASAVAKLSPLRATHGIGGSDCEGGEFAPLFF